MADAPRLVVDGLSVAAEKGGYRLVRDVSFRVSSGETFGLVGESGSGKTLTCRAILRLLPPKVTLTGRVEYLGRQLDKMSEAEMKRVRGSEIAMVFQDPMTALNPLIPVGQSIAQVARSHVSLSRKAGTRRAIEILERVGIRNARQRGSSYPHEFSGGMRQRVLIGMALAAGPGLLLADEPTTALDVIVQAGILDLFRRLCREDGMSVVLVSHDFAVVASVCDRVAVMYAGEIVEEGLVEDVLFHSAHPYTVALIQSVPNESRGSRLDSIPGAPPDPASVAVGCSFAPRCPFASPECVAGPVGMARVSETHWSRCVHVDDVLRLNDRVKKPVVVEGSDIG